MKNPKDILRNHWTGKGGAVAGIGSTLALLGTGPVEQAVQQEPPAIVVEAAPQPEPLYVEAMPQPERVRPPQSLPEPRMTKGEVKVSEVERRDEESGRTYIQRNFEVVDTQQEMAEYQRMVEAWAESTIMDAEVTLKDYQAQAEQWAKSVIEDATAKVESYSKAVTEWMADPVFEETTQDLQQLHQHVGDAASIVQRIIERSEDDPMLVLTALLGYLASLFADPKKPQPKPTDEKTE